MKKQISPSMMCADTMNLGRDLRRLESCGIEYLHIDIMDGVFVPNYTLGTDYIKKLHQNTSIPLDIHLMIERPDLKLDWFEFKEGDYVSLHVEACPHIERALKLIRDRGARPMVAINPGTPLSAIEELLPVIDAVLVMTVNPGFAGQKLVPQTLDKIARLRRMLDERGYNDVEIEVDGNVSYENAAKMNAAGANIFVAGTASLFSKDGTLEENIEKMRAVINK